jgi:uncharacterized membrane protein HdeD (DUF308 family)
MPAGLPMRPETIRKYSTWFMIYGIVLILVGALAIIAPGVATLAIEILIGWVLVGSGIFGLIAVFRAGTSAPGFWWNLLTAVLLLLAGIALLWSPIAGALTLTIILAAFLLATGVTKLVLAFGYRRAIPRAWGWMLVTAVLDLVLGMLILLGLPGTSLWVLGLMVGIDLLFTGVAVFMAALRCRSIVAGEPAARPA